MKRIAKFIYVVSCIALTASCAETQEIFKPQKPDLVDPALNLTRDDYRNLTDPTAIKEAAGSSVPITSANAMEPPVPDLAQILASPKPPKLGQTQLVSIAVTELLAAFEM